MVEVGGGRKLVGVGQKSESDNSQDVMDIMVGFMNSKTWIRSQSQSSVKTERFIRIWP